MPVQSRKHPNARCEDCTLCDAPFVPSYIPEDIQLVVIGEAPGADEVRAREPFVGQSGKLMMGTLRMVGQDITKVMKTNVVSCRPEGNRDPTIVEADCCRGRLMDDLDKAHGAKILAVGKVARETMESISNLPPASSVSDGRGFWHHAEQLDADWIASWHPAYVLRAPDKMIQLKSDTRKAVKGRITSPWVQQPQVIIPQDSAELARLLSIPKKGTRISFDIESDNTRWYPNRESLGDAILMAGVSWSSDAGVVINDELIYDDPAAREVLNRFFADQDNIAAHNGKFDTVFCRANGINAHVNFDTMLAHYAIDETPGTHGLKDLAKEMYGIRDYEKDLVQKYLKSRNDRYSKVPFEHLAQYLAWDVVITRQLSFDLEATLVQQGLIDWPFNNLLMPAQRVLTEVELKGIKVDLEYLKNLQATLHTVLEGLELELRTMAGDPSLNVNSPIQLARIIYDKFRLPTSKSRKVAPRSTAKEALFHLRGMHPFIDKLSEYRRAEKIRSSYVDNLFDFVDLDGFIHCNNMVMGTEVGRLAVRDPALQTVPRPESAKDVPDPRKQYGRMIRAAYIASRPEDRLVICDHSQAELRAMGVLSGEPFLKQVYKDDRDLHSEVALAMYGDSYSKEDRVRCKMFNFSWVYGGNEYSFAQDSGLPIAKAKQFVRDYERQMPVAVAWKASQLQQARTKGYVSSPFGRRRHFPLIVDSNLDDTRKAAVHMPCASTASDLNLLAAIELVDEGFDVKLLVHDSIITDIDEGRAVEAQEYIQNKMVSVATKYLPDITWKADGEVRYRWCDPPKGL